MIGGFFEGLNERGVSPVIAIVLLLMMTVAAAGAAYFWLTSIQSGMQKRSTESIENIMQKSGRRLMAQAAICKPTAPEGMVAWYEFYEGEGNKTHDSSEDENTGTIYGTNWTDGKAGNALKFDGSDDYVKIPDDTSIRIKNEGTIFYWVKFLSFYPDDYESAIGKGHHGGPSWVDIVGPGGKHIYHDIWDPDASERRKPIYLENLETDEWYCLAATHSVSEGYVKTFVDGEYTGNSADLTSIEIGTVPFKIGTSNGYGKYVNAVFDEVRIYDRALSAEEINETYKGKMKVKVTVRNIGSVKIPEAEFVANLKKDGTTVDSDTYTTKSSIDTGDLKTLIFYFNEMRPGGEKYTISIPGIDVSQTVNCQSLES